MITGSHQVPEEYYTSTFTVISVIQDLILTQVTQKYIFKYLKGTHTVLEKENSMKPKGDNPLEIDSMEFHR